jgi:glutathione S-transferase
MRLFYSDASPFARKCRIVLREHGLLDRIEEVATVPLDDPADLRAAAPAGRVPALVLDDGRALTDSKLITEYLDAIGGGAKLYPQGAERWAVLQRAMHAETVMEMAVATRQEQLRPEGQRSPLWLDRWRRGIDGALGALEADPPKGFDIAAIGAVVALDYLDFRLPDPARAARFPRLGAWAAEHVGRASVAETRPR